MKPVKRHQAQQQLSAIKCKAQAVRVLITFSYLGKKKATLLITPGDENGPHNFIFVPLKGLCIICLTAGWKQSFWFLKHK